jgi:anti-sigma regulatory factor (Ser/Thr protein kinase)
VEWHVDATDVRNVRNVRHAFAAYLCAHAVVDEAELATAEIVVDELVANVHRHAAGPASVRLDWQPEPPTLTVSDEGPGFVPEIAAPDPWQIAGRGLYLVQRLVGEVVVKSRAGRGAEVSVRLPVRRRHEEAAAAAADHSWVSGVVASDPTASAL